MTHSLAVRHYLELPAVRSSRPRHAAARVACVASLIVVLTVVTIGLGLVRVLLLGARTDGSVAWE